MKHDETSFCIKNIIRGGVTTPSWNSCFLESFSKCKHSNTTRLHSGSSEASFWLRIYDIWHYHGCRLPTWESETRTIHNKFLNRKRNVQRLTGHHPRQVQTPQVTTKKTSLQRQRSKTVEQNRIRWRVKDGPFHQQQQYLLAFPSFPHGSRLFDTFSTGSSLQLGI